MKLRNWLLMGLAGFGLWQYSRQRERSNRVSLRNKVVIITGASSGIGRASARIFAAQGAHIVLVARRANMLAVVQGELLNEFDVRVLTIAADVTKQEDINTVVRTVLDEFGRIDVLVNNAVFVKGGYLEKKDVKDWQNVIDTNLMGTVRMTQAVLPLMKVQRSGHIVNVSSIGSFVASPGQSVYIATKSGINGFSEALRREVYSSNINVSIVMPGFTDTENNTALLERLSESGMASQLTVEHTDYVASNIVAAVRYNKAQVILGGMQAHLMHILYRISPTIIDFIYTRVIDPDDLARAMNDD